MQPLRIALLALLLVQPAWAAEKKAPPEQDECARKTAACEKQCESRSGMDRLSCKTECRLVETECRNKKR